MNHLNLKVENPGTAELKKFGIITGIILTVLFGLLLPWLFSYQWPIWPWVIAGALWLCALVAPASLFSVYRIWMKFGHVAGWINTRIILGILFFLVFLPAGLLMRIFAKDPMSRKLDNAAKSYRIISAPLEKQHSEKPY